MKLIPTRVSLVICSYCFTSVFLMGQQQNRDETRKYARELLHSPAARYLTQTGRNALELMAVGDAASARSEERVLPDALLGEMIAPAGPVALGETLVNDPGKDIDPIHDRTTQTQPAVAGYNGTILVTYNDSGGVLPTDYYYTYMGYSRSTDFGQTFTDMGGFPTPPYSQNYGGGRLVVDKAGHFYAAVITDSASYYGGGIGIFKSTNGGLTWPVFATPPPGSNSYYGFSESPSIAADVSLSRYAGNIYVSQTFYDYYSQFPVILVNRSTNGGASYRPGVQVSNPAEASQGAEVAVGPDGEVYVAWLRVDTAPRLLMFARSLNGGVSFEAPVAIAPIDEIGFATGVLGGGFRVNSFPRIDVDPVTGYLHVVYSSNPRGPDGADVFIVTSTNRGRNWTAPLRVNTDSTLNDQYHPDVAVNIESQVEVVWYDRRNDPLNMQIDVYRARLSVNGQSIISNDKLSSATFSPAVGYDPIFTPTYMGDFLDLKSGVNSSGKGPAFVSAWGDNRRRITTPGGKRADQDIFFKRYTN